MEDYEREDADECEADNQQATDAHIRMADKNAEAQLAAEDAEEKQKEIAKFANAEAKTADANAKGWQGCKGW
jgi:hypothetical protein